jgi:hypothetical protein
MTHGSLLSLFRTKRLWRGPLIWVLALFAFANFVAARFEKALIAEGKQNLLLIPAPANSAPDSDKNLRTVRYDISVGRDLDRYWSAVPDATSQPLVVLCGMSQMYAINEFKSGDKTISELMDDETAPKGVRVFGLAAPNLCNEEAMLLLLSTLSNPHTKPKVFIYGACFDKYRNLDLRPSYQAHLLRDRELQALWQRTATEFNKEYPLASQKMQSSLRDALATEKKVSDEGMETRLRGLVARYLPLVAVRKELNATVQFRLYEARNWLLNIKPTTKRPIIQARYDLNKEFLRMMADVSKRNGVRLVLYIIPLNPQADNPYIPQQYRQFKAWLQAFCRDQNVPFANFEGIVPREDWGLFQGGPDFKHFKEEGHRLTSRAILDQFGSIVFDEQTIVGKNR